MVITSTVTAQSLPVHDPAQPQAIAGMVRIKLRVDAAEAQTALAPVAEQFGITGVHSWLNPALLRTSTMPHKTSVNLRTSAVIERSLARIVVASYSVNESPERVAAKLASLPNVEYAEPVYRRTLSYVPNDQNISVQWYLDHIGAFTAWDLVRADSSTLIGIIDTGIDPSHKELRDAIQLNPGETGFDGRGKDRRSNGIDDDGNGLIDDWRGYDFGGRDGYSPDNDPTPQHYHGTHVAGIAAATGDDGTGIAGVAFGAKLLSVKISDDARDRDPLLTSGFDGIKYAVDMGARIVNCSWGGPGKSQAEQEVIDYAVSRGSLVVAAAGNEGLNLQIYPASYQGVLSVASVMSSDRRSNFSNFNASVGISAPGEEIYSTVPYTYMPSGFMSASGTSMATPIVAGAAALVATRYPELGAGQIAAVLRATSDDISKLNPQQAYQLGHGRINIERAVRIGPDITSAEILSYDVLQTVDDGAIEPGEDIELRFHVRNILRPATQMLIEVAPIGDPLIIQGPQDILGAMASGEVRESHAGTFRLTIPATAPLDYHLPLSVTLVDNGIIVETRRIELIVNPNYATTDRNRITATFTGNGRIGFNDFPSNNEGAGFQVDSSANILSEGGLLIGVAPDRLVDVVRSNYGLQSQGFQTVTPYRLSRDSSQETGTALFNDDHLHESQRINIDVAMKTIELTGTTEQENQVLVFYTITNKRTYPVYNLHCALYLDWDIGPGGVNNRVEFDPEYRLGYISNVRNTGMPYAGAMLVSNQPIDFTALDNNTIPLSNGFLQAEKWNAISGGIQRETSNIGDASMIIGAGPISLEPGADTTIIFSLNGGRSLTDLRNASAKARAVISALGYLPGEPIILPRQLTLTVTGENPFSEQTRVEFRLPDDQDISLELYNVVGERIAVLASGSMDRGIHEVDIVQDELAKGAYLVVLKTPEQTLVQKLFHVKQ